MSPQNSSPMATLDKPHQDELTFEPETENYAGVKHEWTGTLYVPTAEETRRIETEVAARETSPIVFAEPVLYVRQDQPRGRVKMKMKDALRFRQRGV